MRSIRCVFVCQCMFIFARGCIFACMCHSFRFKCFNNGRIAGIIADEGEFIVNFNHISSSAVAAAAVVAVVAPPTNSAKRPAKGPHKASAAVAPSSTGASAVSQSALPAQAAASGTLQTPALSSSRRSSPRRSSAGLTDGDAAPSAEAAVGPSRTSSAASAASRVPQPIFAGLTFIIALDGVLMRQAEATITTHGGRVVGARHAHTATHAVVPMNYGTTHCPHQQQAEDAPCQVTYVWVLACIAEGVCVSYESEAWFLPNCPCSLPCPALFGSTVCTSTGFRTARRSQVSLVFLQLFACLSPSTRSSLCAIVWE